MRRPIEDWFTVVDPRGRLLWGVNMLLAVIVALVEIAGAAIVVAALQLVTASAGESVDLPVIGDLESRLPGSDRVADLRALAVIAAVFFICRGLLVAAQLYTLYRSTFSLGVRITDRVTAALLERPYSWHLTQNSAELASLAVLVSQQFVVTVFTPVQAAAAQLLLIVGLSSFALVVEPAGTIGAGLVLGVVLLASLRLTRRRLLALGQIDVEETRRGQRLATEALGAIREVKVLDLSGPMRSALRRSRERWAHTLRQRSTLVALPRVVIETAAFSALVVLLAVRGETGAEALAGVGVLGYAVVRLLPTVNTLIVSINTARGGQAALHELAQVLDYSAATGTRLREVDESRLDAGPALPVEAQQLSFSYVDGSELLDRVDLWIGRGTSTGIVGPTGSGKSTLMDLLIGLLQPTEGELTLGGVPLSSQLRTWWRHIGVVPQSITLLDASLAQNVALGHAPEDVDQRALARAIRLAALDDVVAGLESGVHTVLGERGVRLSGGQRQRVAIARALYRDPEVIFLDEGTSALDAATERAVIDGLRADRPDRTLVMVAHRVSTLRECDQILVLDAGRVVARGTHDELMESSPEFRRLAAADED